MAPKKVLQSKKTSTTKLKTKNKNQAQCLSSSERVLRRTNKTKPSGPKSFAENSAFLSSSEKQQNRISLSKIENKENMNNQSQQSIEDRILKMSLEEFQDNTNIVDLIKNHFQKGNYSEEKLKMIFFDIDIYVYRAYEKYQRYPIYRNIEMLKNLKIFDQKEKSQNDSHSKRRNRVEVVVKDGKKRYILIIPKKFSAEESRKLSDCKSNNTGDEVINIESSDETESSSGRNFHIPTKNQRIQQIEDDDSEDATREDLVAPSQKLTQSSDEIPCNQEVKRHSRGTSSSKKQALKQKAMNRDPSPKEGCSKWLYNSPSQTSSQTSIQEYFQHLPSISETNPKKSSEKSERVPNASKKKVMIKEKPGPLSKKRIRLAPEVETQLQNNNTRNTSVEMNKCSESNAHMSGVSFPRNGKKYAASSDSSDDSTPDTSSDDFITIAKKNKKKIISPPSKKKKIISKSSKRIKSKPIKNESKLTEKIEKSPPNLTNNEKMIGSKVGAVKFVDGNENLLDTESTFKCPPLLSSCERKLNKELRKPEPTQPEIEVNENHGKQQTFQRKDDRISKEENPRKRLRSSTNSTLDRESHSSSDSNGVSRVSKRRLFSHLNYTPPDSIHVVDDSEELQGANNTEGKQTSQSKQRIEVKDVSSYLLHKYDKRIQSLPRDNSESRNSNAAADSKASEPGNERINANQDMAPRKVLQSEKTRITENKLQAQRLSPQEGISKRVLRSRNRSESSDPISVAENSASEKQQNNIPLSKTDSKESIEDRVLKMSLEEFQENTNIVEVITDHFQKGNYSEEKLRQILFDIDIYVFRIYHKYQRYPTCRNADMLKKLKIFDQLEKSQKSEQNDSHSKRRNRVEVVVKDGKKRYILIVPKKVSAGESKKLSDCKSNDKSEELINLEPSDETERNFHMPTKNRRTEQIEDDDSEDATRNLVAASQKLTQSSDEIPCNQEVKRHSRGTSSSKKQTLKQKAMNRDPSPKEGCSKWLYNSPSQTSSQTSIQEYFQHLPSISETNPKKSSEKSERVPNARKNVIIKEKPGPLSKKRKHLRSEVETQQQNNQTRNASIEISECLENNALMSKLSLTKNQQKYAVSSDSSDDSIVIPKKKQKKNISPPYENDKTRRGRHINGEDKPIKKIDRSPMNLVNNENKTGSNIEETKSVDRNGKVLDTESVLKRPLLPNSCEKNLNHELRRQEPIRPEIQVEKNQSEQKTCKRNDGISEEENPGKRLRSSTDSNVEHGRNVMAIVHSLPHSNEMSRVSKRRLISNQNYLPEHSFTVVDDREEFHGNNSTEGKQTSQSKEFIDINEIICFFQKYDEQVRNRDIAESLIQHREIVANEAIDDGRQRNELNVNDNYKSSAISALVPTEIDELKERSIDNSDSTSISYQFDKDETVIERISPQIAYIEPLCNDTDEHAQVHSSPHKNKTVENAVVTNEEVNKADDEYLAYRDDITCSSDHQSNVASPTLSIQKDLEQYDAAEDNINQFMIQDTQNLQQTSMNDKDKKKIDESTKPIEMQPKLETNENFDNDAFANDSDVIYIGNESESAIFIEDNDQSLIDEMQQFGNDSLQSPPFPAVTLPNESLQQLTPLSGDVCLSNAESNCYVSVSSGESIQLIEQLENTSTSAEEITANDPGAGGSKDADAIDLTTYQLPLEKHLKKNRRSESGHSDNRKKAYNIEQKSADSNQFTIKQENIDYSQYTDEVQLIPISKKVILIFDGGNDTEALLHEMCHPSEVDFVEEPVSRSSKNPIEMPTGNIPNEERSSSAAEPFPLTMSSTSSNESSLLNQAQIISSTLILSSAENDKMESSQRQLSNSVTDTSIVPFANAPRDPGNSKQTRCEEPNLHKDEARQVCNATSKHIGNSTVQMSKKLQNPADIAIAPEVALNNFSQASASKRNNQSQNAKEVVGAIIKTFIQGRYRPLQVVQEKIDFGRSLTGPGNGPKTNTIAIESTSSFDEEDDRDNLIEDASQHNISHNSTFNPDAYLEGDTSMFGNVFTQSQPIPRDTHETANTNVASEHHKSSVLPTVQKPQNEQSYSETLPLSKLYSPLLCLKYPTLTYLDIKTIKFWRSVQDLQYECSAPFLEHSIDIRAKAIISLPIGRRRIIEVMGNSLQLLLRLTVKEWECVLNLASTIKNFEYQSSAEKPKEKTLPYQILHYLFKSLPRFAQVTLESGPTLYEAQANCAPLLESLDSLKPTTSLTRALDPKLLERLKRLKASSQHGGFSNNSEQLDNDGTVIELRNPQIVHIDHTDINIGNEPSCNDIAARVYASPYENRTVENTIVTTEEVNKADDENSGYCNDITCPSDHQSDVAGHVSATMSTQQVDDHSDAENNINQGIFEKSKNLQQTSMNLEDKKKNDETTKPIEVQPKLETNENFDNDAFANDSDVIYIGNESESVIVIEDNEQSLIDEMQQFGNDSLQFPPFPAVTLANESFQQFTPLSGDSSLSNAESNCYVSVSSGESIQLIEQLENTSTSAEEITANDPGADGSKDVDVIDLTTYQLPLEEHLEENRRSESGQLDNRKEAYNIEQKSADSDQFTVKQEDIDYSQYADEVQLIPASKEVIVIVDGGNDTEALLHEMCNPSEVYFVEEVPQEIALNNFSEASTSKRNNQSQNAQASASVQNKESQNIRESVGAIMKTFIEDGYCPLQVMQEQIDFVHSLTGLSDRPKENTIAIESTSSCDKENECDTPFEDANQHNISHHSTFNPDTYLEGDTSMFGNVSTHSQPKTHGTQESADTTLFRGHHENSVLPIVQKPENERSRAKTLPLSKLYRPLHVWQYSTLTYLDIKTIKLWKNVQDLHYECNTPFLERPTDTRARVTIKFLMDRRCIIEVMGNSLQLLLGLTIKEWECILKLVSMIEKFKNISLNENLEEKMEAYQILHNLFKSFPRFGQVMLECGPTLVESQANYISLSVGMEYLKPIKSLTRALDPKLLERLKRMKASSQHGGFWNE